MLGMYAILMISVTGVLGFLLGVCVAHFISKYKDSDERYSTVGRFKVTIKIGIISIAYLIWIVIACNKI